MSYTQIAATAQDVRLFEYSQTPFLVLGSVAACCFWAEPD